MAREEIYEPLYASFSKFKMNSLLRDGSIFWPEKQLWSRENLEEFKHRVIEGPILGAEKNFHEKLEVQMQGVSPDVWGLSAEIYYLYLLPSAHFRFEKKKANIQWAAQHAGFVLPAQDDLVWESLKKGYTNTGIKYHLKFPQFRLLVLFSLQMKTEASPEAILSDYQKLQAVLDEILEQTPQKIDRGTDMRHAILYLSFPDNYEPIISTQDKLAIIDRFGGGVSKPLAEDPDQAIRQIRAVLENKYGKSFNFYDYVRTEWKPDIGTKHPKELGTGEVPINPEPSGVQPSIDRDLESILATLKYTHNVILYGPPGTGKTYLAKHAALKLIKPQLSQPLSEIQLAQQAISDLPFYSILALSIYLSGPQQSYTVPQLENQTLIKARYQLRPVNNPRANIWGNLQTHTSIDVPTVNLARRAEPYLFDKDTAARWSLTPEGRIFVQENLNDRLALLQPGREKTNKPEDFIKWITFHQSYAYEDFIEGLRPIASEEEPEKVTYAVVPGAFREICERALNDPEKRYVLVIDEINRGNISKVMGELITLVEDDKRSGQPNSLSITLPYSGNSFSVPNNLIIIGTMNTADRSIALLDVALRRRFAFVEVMPRPDLLAGEVVETVDAVLSLDRLLNKINFAITDSIDRDHQIGHSYLLKVTRAKQEDRLGMLEFVWNNQIMPLLQEYFYSRPENLKEILTPFIDEDQEPEDSNAPLEIFTGNNLVVALAELVKMEQKQME